jgi:chromosome segregation ATPase
MIPMETKDDYIKQAEERTNEILSKIDKLESKAQMTKEETLKKLEDQIYELRKKRSQLKDKWEELKNAPENNWNGARLEYEEIMKEPLFERIKYHMLDLEEKMSDLALWSDEKWETFYQKAQTKIKGLNEKINDLETKASEASDKTRGKIKQDLETLKEKRNQLQEKLNEISNTSGEAWKDLKKGFVEAGSSLKDAVRNAYGHVFSKQS